MTQLQIFESLGLCDKYYQLCESHPLRIGEPIEKMPARVVLKNAEGKIEIFKLKGPGAVYKAEGLPEGLGLNYIVQSRTTVETHFQLNELKKDGLGTFAVLCFAVKEETKASKPNPPYPRPKAHTVEELIDVFVKLKHLAIEFYEAIKSK